MNAQLQTKVDRVKIDSKASIRDAFAKMDKDIIRLLCVLEDGEYFGIVSAGDIQRAIIAGKDMETPVCEILRQDLRVASTDESFEEVKKLMIDFRTEFMPILDEDRQLADIVFWEELFGDQQLEKRELGLPVVIMAGGKGTRLKPFSNILPKPLFPLGDKTILEEIMDRFEEVGCKQFYLSVNYKADFIESYLDQVQTEYDIQYFKEEKPLGTAGSLSLLKGELKERFFISNCDIVIDNDYGDIVDYHVNAGNEITLVGALKHIKIPYGTLVTGEHGALQELKEKPELSYLINTGLYLLEPHLIEEVPEDSFYHITDLIEKVKARGGKVGVFPVSEKSWCDIGQWEEYRRTMGILGESF